MITLPSYRGVALGDLQRNLFLKKPMCFASIPNRLAIQASLSTQEHKGLGAALTHAHKESA